MKKYLIYNGPTHVCFASFNMEHEFKEHYVVSDMNVLFGFLGDGWLRNGLLKKYVEYLEFADNFSDAQEALAKELQDDIDTAQTIKKAVEEVLHD